MKLILAVICIGVMMLMLVFFRLGAQSALPQAPGLVDGRLSRCADKPNCVCSEFVNDETHFFHAIAYSQSRAQTMQGLEQVIIEIGGNINAIEGDYLAATFSSRIFSFIDDLELRIDPVAHLVHMRLSARVGYTDRGVNRKRAETLTQRFLALQKAQ